MFIYYFFWRSTVEENKVTTNVEIEQKPLKLNYPKTFKVGLAFAIIMTFWGAYDFVVPLLLEHAYGMSNTLRGLIMGLDNLLSLFLLPLFGGFSDRAKGKLVNKFGRRTPFIVIGTIAAVVLMIFVPVSSKAQLVKSEEIRTEYLSQRADDAFMTETLTYFYEQAEAGNAKYCDITYLNNNNVTKEDFVAIRYHEEATTSGFMGIGTKYLVNGEEANIEDPAVKALFDDNALYNKYVSTGMNEWVSEKVNAEMNIVSLIIYMILLLFTLIAMATFRSPAVALMPDVTPKPLRSQANAVINLCGGVGGALALVIYTVVLFGNNVNNYIIIFGATGAVMLILLGFFMWLVKEKKLVKECEDTCQEYGIEYGDEEEKVVEDSAEAVAEEPAKAKKNLFSFYTEKSPEEKAKFKSFLLILASIFMWFMGYNAVSSNLSVYCTKALNLAPSTASIISGASMAVSAIAFIPVGFLAAKIGRRKSIMIGFGLAVVSYVLLRLFVNPGEGILPALLFAVFYLISGFGLIIANVNTFPMVVELASAKDVGKYTGFYYTATMSAQAITPFIAGLIMDNSSMKDMFIYSAVCVVAAIVLMIFVKHGDSQAIPKGKKMTKEEKKQLMLDSMGDAD